MKNYFAILLTLCSISLSAQIKTPQEFLGYPIGSKFTYHHQIVAYSRYLASQSNGLAQWQVYGYTSEGREQGQMVIANLPSGLTLEQVQKNHQKRIAGESADPTLPVIINLSFNVHGNEAAGSEAALNTLYALISNPNKLISYVILIDPCINPDGRDAYVTQYNRRNFIAGGNPDPNDQEHYEGITSGRYNHFSFDLNRDWVWQTQKETQQRLKFYRSWMPMMHADFHEQSFQHSYYFPPAAKPYLNFIAKSTKDLQESVGRSFSKLFDEKKWPYFTSEVYDLLYPGYGDTYPVLNGALGMTLEQGGIRGGLISAKSDGDTISLVDRVKHHSALALNLVEWSLVNADALKVSFYGVHDKSRTNPTNKYAYYFVPDNELEKGKEFIQLLDKNNITYSEDMSLEKTTQAYDYTLMKQVTLSDKLRGLLIPAKQTSAPLVQALLDPTIALEDSLTYDITAWNLFQLNGLKAYGINENVFNEVKVDSEIIAFTDTMNHLAYLYRPTNFKYTQTVINEAVKAGALVSFSDVQTGDLVISFSNGNNANRLSFLRKTGGGYQSLDSYRSKTSYDLGSTHYKSVFVPKIAVVVDLKLDLAKNDNLWIVEKIYQISETMSPTQIASFHASFAFILFLLGRFLGTYLMGKIASNKVLGVYAIGSVISVIVAMFGGGLAALLALIAVYFFQSIMFPTIFALSCKGLGDGSKLASSLIIMSIVGGALVPPLTASLFKISTVAALSIPLFCFTYIIYYAYKGFEIRD